MTENTEQIITDFDEKADTAAIIAATAQQAVLPRQLRDGQLYAMLDADGAVQIVPTPGYDRDVEDDRAPRPRTIERNVVVNDVNSLLDYINENCDKVGAAHVHSIDDDATGALEVWADLDHSTVTAILDGFNGWRRHTATLQLKQSREWLAWRQVDGKLLDQERFAEFVEDQLSTIAKPDGAKLLEICQTLTGRVGVQWRSQTILANGQRQLKWEESVEAKAGQKGDLTIPEALTLVLRPFQGGPAVAVEARFRYRLRDGQLAIGVKLAEADKVLEDGFAATVAEVQSNLQQDVTVRNGRP